MGQESPLSSLWISFSKRSGCFRVRLFAPDPHFFFLSYQNKKAEKPLGTSIPRGFFSVATQH